MVTEPLRFSHGIGLYVVRTRYSCVCRGLIRVNVLSALISSVSKLIHQFAIGRAQIPNRPEYSLMGVWSVPRLASGVMNVKDPSPFGVQPMGSAPPTRAQSPRLALFGRNSS